MAQHSFAASARLNSTQSELTSANPAVSPSWGTYDPAVGATLTFTCSSTVYIETGWYTDWDLDPSGNTQVNKKTYAYSPTWSFNEYCTKGSGSGSRVTNGVAQPYPSSTTSYPTGTVSYTITVNRDYQYYCTSSGSTGGTVSGDSDGYYVKNATYSITAVPNTKYVFSRWSDGSTSISRNITVNSPIELTAYFELGPNFTITYKPGSTDVRPDTEYTQTKPYDVTVYVRGSTYSRSGYIQTGWTGHRDYNFGSAYTANESETLFPTWNYSRTLTYSDNYSGYTETFEDDNSTLPINFTALSAPTTRPGYEFLGWAPTGGSTYSPGSTIPVYDVWEQIITYTVTGKYDTHYFTNVSPVSQSVRRGYNASPIAATLKNTTEGWVTYPDFERYEITTYSADGWSVNGNVNNYDVTLDNLAVTLKGVYGNAEATAQGSSNTSWDERTKKYACEAFRGEGITNATVQGFPTKQYVTVNTSATWWCQVNPAYEFVGWFNNSGQKVGDTIEYTQTVTEATRLTAVAKLMYGVSFTTSTPDAFKSPIATAVPPGIESVPARVQIEAYLKDNTSTVRYSFSHWHAKKGTISFNGEYTNPSEAYITALSPNDEIEIEVTGIVTNAPKYEVAFQNTSEGLGSVSVSEAQSFNQVTYRYTQPLLSNGQNDHRYVFGGWYSQESGGTLISSSPTYFCPIQPNNTTYKLYARVNFAFAYSTVVQYGSADETLMADDWLTVKAFIDARTSPFNYIVNIPENVYTGAQLTAEMYNEYARLLNLSEKQQGETVTAAAILAIPNKINNLT